MKTKAHGTDQMMSNEQAVGHRLILHHSVGRMR